jgi:hypothetical protein
MSSRGNVIALMLMLVVLGISWQTTRSRQGSSQEAFSWSGDKLLDQAWLCPETTSASDHRFTIPGQVFVGAGVSEGEVAHALSLTAGVLAVYGGGIDIPATMTRLADRRVLSARTEALTKLASSDPQALARRTLTGLRSFMRRVAHPVTSRVNLVFLEEIVDPNDLGGQVLGEVLGMGLSPQLVALSKSDGATEQWVHAAGLSGDFTPTLIVSMRVLRTKADRDVGITLVHELGHAVGLAHDEAEQASLMAAEPPPCVPPLSAHQQQLFEATR